MLLPLHHEMKVSRILLIQSRGNPEASMENLADISGPQVQPNEQI